MWRGGDRFRSTVAVSVGGVAIKFHDSVFTYRFIEQRKRISRTLLSDETLSVRPR
jgi:hypothetical protein